MPKLRYPSHYLGATLKIYGRSLVAIYPLPRGRGRVRKSAPPTLAGLQTLQKWITTTAATAASGRRALTAAETADALSALALLPPGASLADAARAYADRDERAHPIPIRDAIREYLDSLAAANRRPITIVAARYRLSCLDPHADLPTDQLTSADAEKAVRLYRHPTTQNGVKAACRAFFNFCIRRGYALRNPFSAVPSASLDRQPPGIYAPADVARLFDAAERSPAFRRLIPFLAFAFFAGLRSAALYALKGEDVGADFVRVPGWADKKRRGYLAPVSPTLRAWLTAYPLPFPHSPVSPISPRQMLAAIRRLHAAAHVARVPNGARHSFASYAYAASGDATATASALGHFGGVQMLVNHYRALSTPADAAAYFAISPRISRDRKADS